MSEYEVFIIAQELADELGRNVDLIDVSKASTVFKSIILNIQRAAEACIALAIYIVAEKVYVFH